MLQLVSLTLPSVKCHHCLTHDQVCNFVVFYVGDKYCKYYERKIIITHVSNLCLKMSRKINLLVGKNKSYVTDTLKANFKENQIKTNQKLILFSC